jgi:hypothetical protein
MRRGRSTKPAPAGSQPEFSRVVDVSRIGRLEHRLSIAATAEERAALARRFDLIELAELAADLVLKKRSDGLVEVTGHYRARLAQASVVSLEPVWSQLEEALSLFFGAAATTEADALDPLADASAPEPIRDGQIDVGEAVAQCMALAVDPYPRLPQERAPTGDR